MTTSNNTKFNFTYDTTSSKYGYLDNGSVFHPFEEGGTDTSDATATASEILSGYTAYISDGSKATGTIVIRSASDTVLGGNTKKVTYSAGYYPNNWTVSVLGVVTKYTDTTVILSPNRGQLQSTTIGDYALFGGGQLYTGTYNNYKDIHAYNSNLVHTTAANMSQERYRFAATTVGNYALFGTGWAYDSTIDTYNSSLIKGTTNLYYVAGGSAATSVGDYALFAGGADTTTHYNVEVLNSSLTFSRITRVSGHIIVDLCATSIGDYAIFAGGSDNISVYYSTVDVYNSSLTRGTATDLSIARSTLTATTVGNYALCIGGYSSGGATSLVETYDANLTKGTATNLLRNTWQTPATSIRNYALIGSNNSTIMTTYSRTLTQGTASDMTYSRSFGTSTTVGDYALFAGSSDSYTQNNTTIDVYYEA